MVHMIGDALNKNISGSLAGRLIVATPMIQESCFTRSVIYMCSHDAMGAMGVIVNYPIGNIRLKEVLEQLNISTEIELHDLPVHFGGPVESNRGFVVHTSDFEAEGCLINKNGIAVTASVSILHELAQGKGPSQGMLVLGYAGWAPGQLESELETGSWMVVNPSVELVFNAENDTKWGVAVSTLGIDVGHFSSTVGHA
jgi:putative transcriptional regulator